MAVNIKKRLIESLSQIEDDEVAVFMSGGVDSASILYALLELGKKPHCYTFTFDNPKSRDYYLSKATCKIEGVPFDAVILPDSLETLSHDVYRLHDEYGCRKKTEYECTWPFLYAYPAIGEKWIAGGLGAEAHFVLTKRGVLHYRNRPDEFRDEYWSKPNPNQREQHRRLAKKYGKRIVFPYMERETAELFRGVPWEAVNKPHQKQPILDAFPEKYAARKVYPQNLQIGSGASAHFAKLLETPMNRRGYKSVVGIFNDVERGYHVEIQSSFDEGD